MKKYKFLMPLIMLILLCVVIGLFAPRFLSSGNFIRLAAAAAIPMILACGMTFVIIAGSIDLSVEGTLAVCAVVLALLVTNNVNANDFGLWAFPIVILIGAAIGFLNGITHVYLKIPSLLTTLGIGFAGLGLATVLAAGGSVAVSDPQIRNVAFYRVLGIPMAVWIAAGCVLVAYYIQNYTRLGRWTYSLGGGEAIARLSGVPTGRVRVGLYTLAGAFFGLGGGMAAAQFGLGQIQISTGYLFTTITAVVVGGTALTGGVGGILYSVIGVFVIVVLGNGMILLGIPTEAQIGVQGLLTIIAVSLSLDRQTMGLVK
jgi:ribose transport system permease protein